MEERRNDVAEAAVEVDGKVGVEAAVEAGAGAEVAADMVAGKEAKDRSLNVTVSCIY